MLQLNNKTNTFKKYNKQNSPLKMFKSQGNTWHSDRIIKRTFVPENRRSPFK